MIELILQIRFISIHAPHARSDQIRNVVAECRRIFQSTLLMRGATRQWRFRITIAQLFQSTLLMRGATGRYRKYLQQRHISIHAPHARSDHPQGASDCRLMPDFNPRSSCEERQRPHRLSWPIYCNFNPRSSCEERPGRLFSVVEECVFQSTLLMRGATRSHHLYNRPIDDFNPRSSCEERRVFSSIAF